MKASFENHDKVVQLLVTAGATLDLLHRVCIIIYHSVPSKHSWGLKHNSRFWSAWVLYPGSIFHTFV